MKRFSTIFTVINWMIMGCLPYRGRKLNAKDLFYKTLLHSRDLTAFQPGHQCHHGPSTRHWEIHCMEWDARMALRKQRLFLHQCRGNVHSLETHTSYWESLLGELSMFSSALTWMWDHDVTVMVKCTVSSFPSQENYIGRGLTPTT